MNITILLVDDSTYIRQRVAKELNKVAEFTVIGTAHNGQDALNQIPILNPDVIVLDIEMPVLDGLQTLSEIMKQFPRPVIMLSALTRSRQTSSTVKALIRGAFDFVPKPSNKESWDSTFATLIQKIRLAGDNTPLIPPPKSRMSHPPIKIGASRLLKEGDPLLIIGSSTGGPNALAYIMSQLPFLEIAIIIVQHMPPEFTKSLAKRLDQISSFDVQEASNEDQLFLGKAVVCPGDHHLALSSLNQIKLNQSARRNHVRPSVDVTLESATQFHGHNLTSLIITGMGNDGTDGTIAVKKAGGHTIAESEESATIFGMPKEAIDSGCVDSIKPLTQIPHYLAHRFKK